MLSIERSGQYDGTILISSFNKNDVRMVQVGRENRRAWYLRHCAGYKMGVSDVRRVPSLVVTQIYDSL